MSFDVEYFTITPTDSSNRYVNLADGTPVSGSNVVLDIVGGTAQYQGTSGDFGVSGTTVKWNDGTYALYNQVATGDRLRVIYDRS